MWHISHSFSGKLRTPVYRSPAVFIAETNFTACYSAYCLSFVTTCTYENTWINPIVFRLTVWLTKGIKRCFFTISDILLCFILIQCSYNCKFTFVKEFGTPFFIALNVDFQDTLVNICLRVFAAPATDLILDLMIYKYYMYLCTCTTPRTLRSLAERLISTTVVHIPVRVLSVMEHGVNTYTPSFPSPEHLHHRTPYRTITLNPCSTLRTI